MNITKLESIGIFVLVIDTVYAFIVLHFDEVSSLTAHFSRIAILLIIASICIVMSKYLAYKYQQEQLKQLVSKMGIKCN